MMTLELVAAEVAARLVDPKDADEARREARRIASGKSGTAQLSGDLLVIISIAVQVCSVAVGAANLIATGIKRSKEDQVVDILKRIAENTGDSSLAEDENVRKVAKIAVDVLNEPSEKK
jgi:hypothetical protein